MPQLQMPLSIWLESTPAERDEYYISAGFDPNLPVTDSGTDTTTVRFSQEESVPVQPVGTNGLGPGDDLRDRYAFAPMTGLAPSLEESLLAEAALHTGMNGAAPVAAAAGAGISVAGRTLRVILGGGGGRLTSVIWNSLPSFVRTALTQVGIGVGAMVAFDGDIPFITLPFQGGGIDASQEGVGGAMTRSIDIQVGRNPMQPAEVVGSWEANGVTFYRLADGKLAVQNKKGRWKVWRPKKPIVLYSDGASNLKTMLRADKALNKQAKKIAAMLNRRAPRPRKSTKTAVPGIIVQGSGRVVDQT